MLGKFINHCEDSLTAAVFTHLLHLPSEVFWQVLRNACYSESLPAYGGEPSQVDLWPKWDPTGTRNKAYVEPDLFMRFAAFDLIIEAKRPDEGKQDSGQWQRELIAYANEYGEEKQAVRMIAVGGVHTEQDETINHVWHPLSADEGDAGRKPYAVTCPVHMCRWERLLDQCKRMRRELDRLEYYNSQTKATGRILDDIIDLFGWHGYSTGRWFADFDFDHYRLSTSTESQCDLFRSLSNRWASK